MNRITIVIALIASLIAVTVSASGNLPSEFRVIHDDEHNVTCWYAQNRAWQLIGGVSCLPDWMLR